MDDHTWTVIYMDGDNQTIERVVAEGWQINRNGDLALGNDIGTPSQFLSRAFAKGVWLEIRLYA